MSVSYLVRDTKEVPEVLDANLEMVHILYCHTVRSHSTKSSPERSVPVRGPSWS